MKRITFSRKQILRAIHAACVALFFAACATKAGAVPLPAVNYYSGSGSTWAGSTTGTGSTTTSAYFYDPTTVNPTSYSITVGSGLTLGNSTEWNDNEIEFATGSVNNSGSLYGENNGIEIYDAGSVTNASGGEISAEDDAVSIGGNGTVNNAGNIYSYDSSSGYGIYINGTGTVTNSGYIGVYNHDSSTGIDIEAGGTVTNRGLISAYNGYYDNMGVYINGSVNPGTVTNSGGIFAYNYNNGFNEATNYGIDINGTGTVNNSGTVRSYSGYYGNYGVYISGTGTVNNTGSIYAYSEYDSNSNYANYGVYIGGNGTVTNSDEIEAYDSYSLNYGVYIGQNGMVTNSGYIGASGSDYGNYGVYIGQNGTVNNTGSIYAKYTGGSNYGVYIGQNGTVNNSGSISAYSADDNNYGVYIGGMGTVNNSGNIFAYDQGGEGFGVYIVGAGNVTNSGSIYGSDIGVGLLGGGTVTNTAAGTISSDYANSASVYILGTGTVTNSGSIYNGSTSGHSIYINGNGTISNSATGNMTSGLGVYVSGSGSLYNSGTIIATNGYGVDFGSTASVVLAGGTVVSGNGGYAVEVNAFGGAASSVTVIGRASLTGQMISNTTLGTLNLNLVGLTPAKAAELRLDAINSPDNNTFVLGPNTYQWANLALVDNSISLEQVVDSGLVSAAKAIDNATSTVGLPPGFDPFYVDAATNPESAMNKLVGREILQGTDTLQVNLNTTIASDLNEHLDNILTGNQIGGFDVGGVHVSDAGSMVAMGDTTSQLSSLLRMNDAVNIRGTEMSTDTKAMVSTPPPPSWGVWASGNVTLGDEQGPSTLSNFHSTIGSPTFGVDYRVAQNLVIGAFVSYTTLGADFNDGSQIDNDTELLGLYGTWRDGNWHVNGMAAGGLVQYNNTRTTFGGSAGSSPDGDDVVTDWTAGYDFNLGDRFVITPEVGPQYSHVDINSYTESGAGIFNLSEASQSIDSLRSHVGFKIDKAYSLGKDLTFVPELRALWYHEFLDDSRGVGTSLPGAPAVGSFSVNTFSPQRDFALVGLGLNTAFTGYKGVPVGMFLNYNAQVGQSDYIANSVNAGLRVDF